MTTYEASASLGRSADRGGCGLLGSGGSVDGGASSRSGARALGSRDHARGAGDGDALVAGHATRWSSRGSARSSGGGGRARARDGTASAGVGGGDSGVGSFGHWNSHVARWAVVGGWGGRSWGPQEWSARCQKVSAPRRDRRLTRRLFIAAAVLIIASAAGSRWDRSLRSRGRWDRSLGGRGRWDRSLGGRGRGHSGSCEAVCDQLDVCL